MYFHNNVFLIIAKFSWMQKPLYNKCITYLLLKRLNVFILHFRRLHLKLMTFIGNADGTKVISEKVTHFGSPAARVYPRSYKIFDSSNPRTRFNDSNGTNLQKFSNISHYRRDGDRPSSW